MYVERNVESLRDRHGLHLEDGGAVRQGQSWSRWRGHAHGWRLVWSGCCVCISAYRSGISKKKFQINLWRLQLDESSHRNTPELLNGVLFAGEEQPLELFPLDADNQASSQDSEEGHQDAHGHVPAVCSPAHMGTETGKELMSFSVEDYLAGKVHLDPKSLEIFK